MDDKNKELLNYYELTKLINDNSCILNFILNSRGIE